MWMMFALTRRANVGQGEQNSEDAETNNKFAHGDHLAVHLSHHVINLGVGQMAKVRRVHVTHLLLLLIEESFVVRIIHLGDGR